MGNYLQLCIFLFCFLLLVNGAEFGAEPDDQCEETRCKHHGPTIRFPFWLKDRQPDHCGYPGFELFCAENNYTMLELPRSVKLFVKQIDYTAQQVDVYDPDGCVQGLLPNLNLTASPFQFAYLYGPYNYTFFNCSSDNPYKGIVIPCLSSHGYQIVAVDSDTGAYAAPLSCPKMYDLISVPDSLIDGYANDFQLMWSKPMCGSCEAEGKKCGMKGNTSETQCSPNKKQHTGVLVFNYLISSIYFTVDHLEL